MMSELIFWLLLDLKLFRGRIICLKSTTRTPEQCIQSVQNQQKRHQHKGGQMGYFFLTKTENTILNLKIFCHCSDIAYFYNKKLIFRQQLMMTSAKTGPPVRSFCYFSIKFSIFCYFTQPISMFRGSLLLKFL